MSWTVIFQSRGAIRRLYIGIVAKESTKQRILNAAVRTINEKGEAGVRIDDLLAEVNVTAPSLYHHFGSREGLMVEAQAERFAQSIQTGVDEFVNACRNSTTVEELRLGVRQALAMRSDKRRIEHRLQRLNALGAAYARPELAKKIVDAHESMVFEVARALEPLQTKGLIRSDINLQAVVAWYNGALMGGLLVELEGSTLDANDWDTVMLDAIDKLLFGL